MSYTPTNWSNGDSITAAKLNKMEQGIEDASGGGAEPLIVNVVDDSDHAKMVFDKTWNEVKTAFGGGQSVVLSVSDSSSDEFYQAIQVISKSKYDTPAYNVQTSTSTYSCNTADGYPEYYYGD